MKNDTELKAIAFDSYIKAAASNDAPIEMKVGSVTLNAIYAAEKLKDNNKGDVK